MKRKWGVVVITLPIHKGLSSLPSLYPFEAGDIVPYKQLSGLSQTKQRTIPVNLMKRKTVVVDLFSAISGNHIAVFPPMESLKKLHSGRTHVLALSWESMVKCDLHLGNASEMAIPLEIQCLKEQHSRFLLHDNLPSLLLLSEDNEVLQTTTGIYLNRHTIRAFVQNNLSLQIKRVERNLTHRGYSTSVYAFRSLKPNY
jgi:hypothetical protein